MIGHMVMRKERDEVWDEEVKTILYICKRFLGKKKGVLKPLKITCYL